MRTFTAFDFNDVQVLMDKKEYERAYDLLIEIHDYAKNILQYESPYVIYFIGLCHANLGRNYLAVDCAGKAKKLDPLNHDVAMFYSNMLIEIENSLGNLIPFGAEKRIEIEKIYAFLMERGQVRSSLQFNMIRYYIMVNELELARPMLENFLERNPNDEEAKFMYTSLTSFAVKNHRIDQKTKVKCA